MASTEYTATVGLINAGQIRAVILDQPRRPGADRPVDAFVPAGEWRTLIAEDDSGA